MIEKNKYLNLNLFWGERNLYLNLKDLKFGNFKKGKCISFYDNNKLINSLLNCKKKILVIIIKKKMLYVTILIKADNILFFWSI